MAYVKYKEEEDVLHASRANAYVEANPATSRVELARAVGISRERLDRLARIGLITKYPRPLTTSQAASIGRKNGNPWGKSFYLRGTPR